jgi:uncharacterized protein (DUF1499 family)
MNIVKFCLLTALLLAFAGCTAAHSQAPWEDGGMLAPCPDSPNCVSSQSEDPGHKIAPFEYTGTPESGFARLRKILAARPDTRITISIPTYLKVEFRTFLGFVDDGEFYLDTEKKVIECRSASRSGYWDLGTNRSRMEEIRNQFDQKPADSQKQGTSLQQKENP